MNDLQRRAALIRNKKITLVLDVGANKGQFARSLRDHISYRGRIVSFEPLRDAFSILQQMTANDPLWTCHNIALGDADGAATINVSANSHSSSLLPVSDRSVAIEPSTQYIGKQDITVCRLDGVLNAIAQPHEAIFLKVDTQGYEMQVLNGALGVINRFELIQLETSFFSVYSGERLIGDVIKFMDYLGYGVMSIEAGWEDPRTGELLQADVIFGRR